MVKRTGILKEDTLMKLEYPVNLLYEIFRNNNSIKRLGDNLTEGRVVNALYTDENFASVTEFKDPLGVTRHLVALPADIDDGLRKALDKKDYELFNARYRYCSELDTDEKKQVLRVLRDIDNDDEKLRLIVFGYKLGTLLNDFDNFKSRFREETLEFKSEHWIV